MKIQLGSRGKIGFFGIHSHISLNIEGLLDDVYRRFTPFFGIFGKRQVERDLKPDFLAIIRCYK
ncbi:MAG: hypothetical protein WC487_04345 [Candidatus Omnitrophota bacterium]